MAYLKGLGWLNKVSVSNTKINQRAGGKTLIGDVTKNSPDRSIGVMNLGLHNVPKPVNIFLDVEHRQRHGTSEP